jgi:hypothetical protein
MPVLGTKHRRLGHHAFRKLRPGSARKGKKRLFRTVLSGKRKDSGGWSVATPNPWTRTEMKSLSRSASPTTFMA